MYNVIPQQPQNGFTVVELFAGGGLMAAGLKAAGYNLIWANDFEKAPCIAYAHNIGQHIIQADLTEINPRFIPGSDIIAGGPPCQDYSVAGQGAGEEGERGKLVWTYLDIIKAKQPKAFIFENVKGLTQQKHRHTFDALLLQFEAIGYTVSHKLINAWDFGVAQKRERIFIVGIRKDLGFAFKFPQPSEAEYRTQVLRDVIGDLPEPLDRTHTVQNPHDNPSLMDEPAKTVVASTTGGKNCFFPNHNPEKQLPQGYQNVIDGKTRTNFGVGIPINDGSQPARTLLARYWEKGPPSEVYQPPMNHEGKEISDKAMEGYARRNAPGAFGFRVNEWDEPSPTIMGRIFNEGKAFVHPGPIDNQTEKNPQDGRYSSQYLSRNRVVAWDQAAYAVLTNPRDASIHPGDGTVSMEAVRNHAGPVGNHHGALFDNVGNNPTWEHANREADLDKPAPTRTEKDRCDGINTINGRPRRFTVRECLRIQSVPDWYILPKTISLSAQYKVVGNGVASRVAYVLGWELAAQLHAAAEEPFANQGGA